MAGWGNKLGMNIDFFRNSELGTFECTFEFFKNKIRKNVHTKSKKNMRFLNEKLWKNEKKCAVFWILSDFK